MKVKEVLQLLKEDDWMLVGQKGSHRQFKHATKPGKVTVSGKESADMALPTLRSIYRQAGWDWRQ